MQDLPSAIICALGYASYTNEYRLNQAAILTNECRLDQAVILRLDL